MAEIKKTLGGDRIGSGKKMQVELDGYVRSNFDLSQVWRSSQAPGTVVPCYVNIGQKGDTWNFDLSALVRTKPTTGPLYGSFKFEVLFFAADIRLYNGALHNNALNLGLEMQNVVYPKVELPIKGWPNEIDNTQSLAWQIQKQNMSPSALMAYLGVTNPGSQNQTTTENNITYRYFNGMPLLMYWDVVKNFLINKQEKNAWYIGVQKGDVIDYTTINYYQSGWTTGANSKGAMIKTTPISDKNNEQVGYEKLLYSSNNASWAVFEDAQSMTFSVNNKLDNSNLNDLTENCLILLKGTDGNTKGFSCTSLTNISISEKSIFLTFSTEKIQEFCSQNPGYNTNFNSSGGPTLAVVGLGMKTKQGLTPSTETISELKKMQLNAFPIENLDKARGIILKNFFEGENVTIRATNETSDNQTINFEPYSAVCETGVDSENNLQTFNSFSQNGLAIKTYSNDIFNAFLDSETIEKINQQTAASISNGQLQISNLILAEKIYKLQNKIAVAGGTYEDWQEAVYGISTAPANESPRFIGGLSSEIVFDEVISSSATEINGETSPLGALGGRGSLNGMKGGKFELEVKEDCIIMGLCIITPRIDYSQGNKWFMSLQNNDQLHKPELDRIGFQNLMGEWMCGADTNVPGNATPTGWGNQKAYAMQPAWEHYMTAFNECHGDFADEEQAMYMTLNRRYEIETNSDGIAEIKDFTSYIDPTKYNYAFADTTIESQNFWTQIGMDIKVRRVMSSKIMPNL